MSEVKKARCPVPSAVAAACRAYLDATRPRTSAQGSAALIGEGVALITEGRPGADRLAARCRQKYPTFDAVLSTHIPASLREQARHLKRRRGLASLQELYLEAVLAALTRQGFLGPDLEPRVAPGRTG